MTSRKQTQITKQGVWYSPYRAQTGDDAIDSQKINSKVYKQWIALHKSDELLKPFKFDKYDGFYHHMTHMGSKASLFSNVTCLGIWEDDVDQVSD